MKGLLIDIADTVDVLGLALLVLFIVIVLYGFIGGGGLIDNDHGGHDREVVNRVENTCAAAPGGPLIP